MKKLLLTSCACFALACAKPSTAAVFQIDISPISGALNLGSTTYTQDHAIGLTALNAVGQPASPATGNELGLGITYDDLTNILAYDFGYGSAFGFVDLAGSYSVAHFHGPVSVQFPAPNTGAGTLGLGLAANHSPSGSVSGRFTGTATLSAAQETMLFDNEIYINIHSSFAGGGEIRGQLIPVPEPASLLFCAVGGLMLFRRRR